MQGIVKIEGSESAGVYACITAWLGPFFFSQKQFHHPHVRSKSEMMITSFFSSPVLGHPPFSGQLPRLVTYTCTYLERLAGLYSNPSVSSRSVSQLVPLFYNPLLTPPLIIRPFALVPKGNILC